MGNLDSVPVCSVKPLSSALCDDTPFLLTSAMLCSVQIFKLVNAQLTSIPVIFTVFGGHM